MTSLRTELWRWMIGLLASVGLATAAISYWDAGNEARRFFDQQLRLIALNADITGKAQIAAPRDNAPHDPEDDFVVQVWDAQGHPRQTRAPGPDIPRGTVTGFRDVNGASGHWRTYTLVTRGDTIQVSQQIVVREELATDAALRSLYPLAIIIPLSWLVLGLVINRVLGKLDTLAAALNRRQVLDRRPLPTDGTPKELMPFVAAVNEALAEQGRFVSAAAHTLRTPLTALQIQVTNLRHALGSTDAPARLDDLERGVKRAIELARKLLRLGRSKERASKAITPLDLADIVRSVVAELLPLSDQKHLDVGVTRSDACLVLAEPEDLRTLIGNLLENAIHYTPPQGTIDLSVIASEDSVTLEICDTGPGIPEDEIERVFAPFHRLGSQRVEGTGLGLSIVASIVERYGAAVKLTNRTGDRGLAAEAVFARYKPAAAPHSALSLAR